MNCPYCEYCLADRPYHPNHWQMINCPLCDTNRNVVWQDANEVDWGERGMYCIRCKHHFDISLTDVGWTILNLRKEIDTFKLS